MSKQLMTKKAVLVFSLMVCFTLATIAAFGVNPIHATAVADCDNVAVVKSIYKQIKVKYDGQKSHINVRIKDNILTLEGWVTTKAVKKEIEKYAKKTKCVKMVENKLGVGAGAGCGPGQIKCGDICISSQSECNIGMPEN